jgi:hypothetical protein
MRITVELDLREEQDSRSKIADLTAMLDLLHPEKAEPVGQTVAPEPQSAARNTPSEPPLSGDDTLEFLGDGARKVVSTILSLIQRNGQTTLEEVSTVTGDGLPTLRAHLANAGRTFKHANLREPYKAAWISEQHCVVYRAADAA